MRMRSSMHIFMVLCKSFSISSTIRMKNYMLAALESKKRLFRIHRKANFLARAGEEIKQQGQCDDLTRSQKKRDGHVNIETSSETTLIQNFPEEIAFLRLAINSLENLLRSRERPLKVMKKKICKSSKKAPQS